MLKTRFACFVLFVMMFSVFIVGCSDDDDDNPASNPTTTELKIAALIPQTGSYSEQGDNFVAAVTLAAEDVNEDFANRGLNTEIDLACSDTRTDPNIAETLLDAFLAQDFRMIVGPLTSSEVSGVEEMINASESILISPSSTMMTMAIEDDNIYRIAPNDSRMVEATVQAMITQGITHLGIVHIDDAWGQSLADMMAAEFVAEGGTVFATSSFIGSRMSELTDSLAVMNAALDTFLLTGDPATTAIQLICFDVGSVILELAATDTTLGTLGEVRWYGSDGFVNNETLLSDFPGAAEFAADVSLTSPIFGVEVSTAYQSVAIRIEQATGTAPGIYPLLAYDAVVAAANALQSEGQDATIAELRAALESILANNPGVTGTVNLDAAGDRTEGTYYFWKVVENGGSYEWNHVLTYEDGSIVQP